MSSTHWCEACKTNIKISFGGDANWQAHINSSAHGRNERSEAGSAMTSASGMQDLLCGSDADRNRFKGLPKIEIVT